MIVIEKNILIEKYLEVLQALTEKTFDCCWNYQTL